MPELIRIAPRRETTSTSGPDAVARVRPRGGVERALDDARSVLPWHDLGKPGREKLALYGLSGLIWASLVRSFVPFFAHSLGELGKGERWAALLALTTLSVTLLPSVLAFLGSLAFQWLSGGGAEGRLGQALVCPYCRDGVDREGTVICGRDKCGALYHRECWDECSQAYGGCAVYGCSSRKCREVSAAGWIIRLTKLIVAAALFPPRAVKALRKNEMESAASVYRRAVAASRGIYVWTNEGTGRQLWFVGAGVILSYIVAVPIMMSVPMYRLNDAIGYSLIPIFGLPFFMLVLPYLVALPFVFALTFGRALKRVLEAEFAALERADQGGGTVLGRLAAGFGAKKA